MPGILPSGRSRISCPSCVARPQHGHARRQLSRRQIHAPAWQGRQGLFPGRRHGLFQRRPEALRRDQAGRQQPLADRDIFRELGRRARHRRQRLAGAAPQHPARHSHPDAMVAQRLRRPLRLQPLPSAPEARAYADRALPGRDRELPGRRHLDSRRRALPLRARLSPRIRADEAEPLAREPSRPLLLPTLPRRREQAGIDARRPARRKSRPTSSAYLDERLRLARRHGRGLLARRHAQRRRARRVSRFAQRPSSPRWSPKSARRCARRDVAVIPSVARPTGGAWYEGSDLAALAETAGIIEACFYEPSAMRVRPTPGT